MSPTHMTLSQLIAKVGDELIKVEPVDINIRNARKAAKGGTSRTIIELETAMVDPAHLLNMNAAPYMGLVVWLPRAAVQAAIKK